MKGVQCYELFGEIALKIHTFSFFFIVFAPSSIYMYYELSVTCSAMIRFLKISAVRTIAKASMTSFIKR